MRHRKISLFDGLLLLLVVLLGAGVYWKLHTREAPAAPDSVTVLMDDLRRNSDINTEPSAMEETEDGISADLTISIFAVFTKTSVTTPSSASLKVGAELALKNQNGETIPVGVVTWIKH